MGNRHTKLAQRLLKTHRDPEALYTALLASGAPECVAREWQNVQDRNMKRADSHQARTLHTRDEPDHARYPVRYSVPERYGYTPFPGWADNVSKQQVDAFMLNLIGHMEGVPTARRVMAMMAKRSDG